MQSTTWRVVPRGRPAIQTHCPHCGPSRFQISGRFRVNARQKRVDVWLLYRCEGCGHSHKLSILRHALPRQLEQQGLLERFVQNDAALADRYSRDLSLLCKNGVTPIAEPDAFGVEGPALSRLPCRLQIYCPPGCELRLDKILAHKLGLSRGAVGAWLRSDRVQSEGKRTAAHRVRGCVELCILGWPGEQNGQALALLPE